MDSPRQNDGDARELRALVERIKRGDCVLVLGPRVAIRAGDADRRPLDELLAEELLMNIEAPPTELALSSSNLRRAADLHYRLRHDRDDLELTAHDFYARAAASTTEFHRDLAQLPFRLCVCTSPDSLMLTAFGEAGKAPASSLYNFKVKTADSVHLPTPTVEKPLVYHLFGHHEEPRSLVLTEGDLIEFLVSIVKGTPQVPDQVRSKLADPAASFLFLGFGFHHWYLRVLLQVMDVYGHRSKAFAFEDPQFFDHPERDQAVGFFSGDRLIEFRRLRWEEFARQLRDTYGEAAPRTQPREAPAANAPKAFLSYASDDREAVDALSEQLQSRGIAVWQDRQDLRAGDNWSRVLFDVIERIVDYVVVVQTPAMTGRIEGVFHVEIEAAQRRQARMGEADGRQFRFLIPVRMGGGALLSSLSHAHAIDVDQPGGIDSLVHSIQEDWRQRNAKKVAS